MRDSETTLAIQEQLRTTQELWRITRKEREDVRRERAELENDFTK